MPLRVGDATAVLDELGIDRAHFIGKSWGGRLAFGIAEHAPERVLSLVIEFGDPLHALRVTPISLAIAATGSRSLSTGWEACSL